MKRRDFLRNTALGSAMAIGVPGAEAIGKVEGAPPATRQSGLQLEETSVAQLQQAMAAGRTSCEQLASAYLQRIDSIDQAGPGVRSILEINPDWRRLAAALDAERAAGQVRGPLHGIPVVIKDNIDTADDMHTTAGSLALLDAPVPDDAFIVTRLREAGALILAKANLSEWANIRSTRSSSGWSGRGGQTRNPYALDRSPCGSSSGSAAAVSASLCALAIGTETDGSIICPSNACGIVGIKPTLGLWSRAGIIPIAHSQDTAGPMARTVADAAALLGPLVGADSNDSATAAAAQRGHADYTQFLDADGLRGARIGVARNFFGSHERIDALMEAAIAAMRGVGTEIIDPAPIPNADQYDDTEFTVLLYELKADLDAYLQNRGGPIRSLADVIAFNAGNAEREMPYFRQEIFELAQAKGALSDPEYLEALAANHRLSRDEGIDQVMQQHSLDALVAPSGGPAWPIDLVTGDHFLAGSSTAAAVSGYPSITVPAGRIFGLPVGISFVASAWQEPQLIRLAYAFEQATRHRVAPRFLPTADLSS